MAKIGEGDARWIVQERADGTNVHGWHWQEKDVIRWSRDRLTALLSNQQLLTAEDQTEITTTTVDSVTGEALINNRKQKLIPSYELAVKGQWKGQIKDGSQTVVAAASGTFQLPYISDENADEDPELTVSLTEEGSGQQRLKQAFVNKGKKASTCVAVSDCFCPTSMLKQCYYHLTPTWPVSMLKQCCYHFKHCQCGQVVSLHCTEPTSETVL